MKKIGKLFNSATEFLRGAAERAGIAARWPVIKQATPEGDGHPVLLLPGFMTSDAYMNPLRDMVEQKGYKVYTWGKGINLGLNDETAEHLHHRLNEIFAENGGRKITLVGHSLGGIYARELAREYPEMVRAVVTMGSPFGMQTDATPVMLQKLYALFNVGTDHLGNEELQRRGLTPPPVPTTSIFSKSDGIVDWPASLNPKSPQCENIQVHSSHLGMIVNPLAVLALLDRLAEPEGAWKPFDAKKYDAAFPKGVEDAHLPDNPEWDHTAPDAKPLFRKKDRG